MLHAVCVPHPAQGHIKPMFELAKLLYAKGFHITFVNTEYNNSRLLRARGPNAVDGLKHFRFEAIPDGLPPSDEDVTQDVPSTCYAIMNYFIEPFKKLLLKLNDPSSGSPPVSFIVSDCTMTFAFDAAQQMGGIPFLWVWTASACGFLGYLQCSVLLNKGIVPFQDLTNLTDGSLDMVVDWVPSLKDVQLKYLPSFVKTTNRDDVMFSFMMYAVEKPAQSSAPIIFNSFDEFEREVFEDIFKRVIGSIYTVGPFRLQLRNALEDVAVKSLRANLWKEDLQCLQWLDSKNPKSVVYVSFGSITTMTNENLVEFAWGLANSGHPFLWILRPGLVSGESALMPSEFLAETRGRGLITSWCDQEAVLNHPSVGAFLTHSGWNSTLDTICSGVPVLCWPFFGEQPTNSWLSSEKWRIGTEIDNNVRRTNVEKQIRELMESAKGKEMARNAMEWKKLAEEATSTPRGSSYLQFEKLLNEVLLPLKHRKGRS